MKTKIDIEKEIIQLTEKQKTFCELYVSKDFFGNGVQSYIGAYGINNKKKGAYESAKTCAHRLLTNVDILSFISHLLEESGLNDSFIDKQLLFLITQHSDLGIKLGAIREYNKLKQRLSKKIDHTHVVIDFSS